LRVLINTNPKILRTKNSDVWYPLHLLCSVADVIQESPIIQKVATIWPNVLYLPNSMVQTPLHILCARWHIIALEDDSHHYNHFEKVVNSTDLNGNTPLHLVVSSQSSRQMEALNYLFSNFYIDVKCQNARGKSPLDTIVYQMCNV
jgi:ankyrin repeat protein